ncbi:MAG: WhiB family transcriptional regulator [Acidimicrobiia bacterium]
MPMAKQQLETKVDNWREAAACRDLALSFFPTPDDSEGIALAKSVCAACPVQGDCLAYAIETNQSEGIWGAHTASERARLRRRLLRELREAS